MPLNRSVKQALNANGGAPVFGVRAWVVFNGTGTLSVTSSGNVTSVTDDGVGIYTVNFTVAMPDSNYAVAGSTLRPSGGSNSGFGVNSSTYTSPLLKSTSQVQVSCGQATDTDNGSVSIFVLR